MGNPDGASGYLQKILDGQRRIEQQQTSMLDQLGHQNKRITDLETKVSKMLKSHSGGSGGSALNPKGVDFIQPLQILVDKRKLPQPVWEIQSTANLPPFVATVNVGDVVGKATVTEGKKTEAKKMAARDLLLTLTGLAGTATDQELVDACKPTKAEKAEKNRNKKGKKERKPRERRPRPDKPEGGEGKEGSDESAEAVPASGADINFTDP